MAKRNPIIVIVFFIGLLAVILVTSSGMLFNPIPKDAKIILNRRGCFSLEGASPCPVYTVTIYGDGSATFTGEYFVQTIGTVHYNIPTEDIRSLFNEVEEANFFALADKYNVEVKEYTGATTTIVMSGKRKEIEHYGAGCNTANPALDSGPESLCRLEALIDEIGRTNRYIYGTE